MTTLAFIIAGVLASFAWGFWVLRRQARAQGRTRVRVTKKQVRQMRVPYYF